MDIRPSAVVTLALLAGCGTPPKGNETVWATVAEVYTAEKLKQSFNQRISDYARRSGMSDSEIDAGRVVRVACGIGTSYVWGSFAYLPPGLAVTTDQVVRVAVQDPGDDNRLGWNPVLGAVDGFPFRGSSPAYRFIPDWKERGLWSNLESVPLAPEQRGRYVHSHSDYLIKCRQPARD